MPQTLKSPVFHELIIKKSRFLAWVEPVRDAEQAKQRIAELRQNYSDARHVCFAFYTQGQSGMSDDGEPSGTAGKPIFNVLNHKHLVDVIAIVVRYFGGVKLGAGGLVRAYGGAVSVALEAAEFVLVEQQVEIQLQFPFSLESQVRHVTDQFGLLLSNVDYQQHVSGELTVAHSSLEAIVKALQAIAPGNPEFSIQVIDS